MTRLNSKSNSKSSINHLMKQALLNQVLFYPVNKLKLQGTALLRANTTGGRERLMQEEPFQIGRNLEQPGM